MISQDFTAPLLTIQHCLRRGFAQFKLCAHFLDLCCLLFKLGAQMLKMGQSSLFQQDCLGFSGNVKNED
jgi:hypothetical protein